MRGLLNEPQYELGYVSLGPESRYTRLHSSALRMTTARELADGSVIYMKRTGMLSSSVSETTRGSTTWYRLHVGGRDMEIGLRDFFYRFSPVVIEHEGLFVLYERTVAGGASEPYLDITPFDSGHKLNRFSRLVGKDTISIDCDRAGINCVVKQKSVAPKGVSHFTRTLHYFNEDSTCQVESLPIWIERPRINSTGTTIAALVSDSPYELTLPGKRLAIISIDRQGCKHTVEFFGLSLD